MAGKSKGKGGGGVPRGTPSDAQRIAELYLALIGKVAQVREVYVQGVRPLFSPNGKSGEFFEAKLSSDQVADHGYMIVSLSQAYTPIRCIVLYGPTPTEQLQSLTGQYKFRTVVFTGVYFTAEADSGKPLAELGPKPSIGGRKPGYDTFKAAFIKQERRVRKEKQELTNQAWRLITGQTKSHRGSESLRSVLLDVQALPLLSYERLEVSHPLRLPRYVQLLPNFAENAAHDFWTGCVACAWMCLIGYYDNTKTPDLLRGTFGATSSLDWGYPARVMVQLSEYLGTEAADDGGGSVSRENTDRGYSFITEKLGNPVRVPDFVDGEAMPALQLVYDHLGSYRAPSVVGTMDHMMIAYAGWFAIDPDDGQQHFLKVYTGWQAKNMPSEAPEHSPEMRYWADPWIPWQELNGAYSLQGIDSRSEVTIPQGALHAPVSSELNGRLFLAYRQPDENIGILFSDDGYNFSLQQAIPATGTTPPTLTLTDDGKALLICWAEENRRLKLAELGRSGDLTWFPAPPLPGSAIGPTMTSHENKLYVLWGNDLVYAPLEDVKRLHSPWPQSCGGPIAETYWTSLGTYQPAAPPSLVSDGTYLYLGSVHGDGSSYVMLLDRTGNVVSHFDVSQQTTIERYPCGANLCYMSWYNHDFNVPASLLYGSTNGTIYVIQQKREIVFDVAGNPLGTREWLEPREELRPYGIPSMEQVDNADGIPIHLRPSRVTLGSFSAIDFGPCLFSSWVDSQSRIHVRYHSLDFNWTNGGAHRYALTYDGWPRD